VKEAGLTEMPVSRIRERMACAGQETPTGRLAVHVVCNDIATGGILRR
jgi:hypothetical protein